MKTNFYFLSHSHDVILPAIHTVSPSSKRRSAFGFVMNSSPFSTLMIMHWKSANEQSFRTLPVRYESAPKVNDSTLKSSWLLGPKLDGTDPAIIFLSFASCSVVPTQTSLSNGYTLTSEVGITIFLSPLEIFMMLAPLSCLIGMLLRRCPVNSEFWGSTMVSIWTSYPFRF